MNYIYNIYLNLNKTLYDFYDWNKNDKLTHIKKTPIFETNEKNLRYFIENIVKIEKSFLLEIYNKTVLWNMNKKLEYCCLFCDKNNILAIEFDKNGVTKNKSFLYIEDELDVLENFEKINEKQFRFEIIQKEKNLLKTRKQIKEEKFIKDSLKNIEDSKLNYIFFECFGYYEKNKNNIINHINKIDSNSKTFKNLYDILKLTSINKK